MVFALILNTIEFVYDLFALLTRRTREAFAELYNFLLEMIHIDTWDARIRYVGNFIDEILAPSDVRALFNDRRVLLTFVCCSVSGLDSDVCPFLRFGEPL
jgi:hypothetical protein